MINSSEYTKLQLANIYGQVKLTLYDGNVLIGKAIGIEYEEDEEGNDTNVEMLAFVPTFINSGFYLYEKQIRTVEPYNMEEQ